MARTTRRNLFLLIYGKKDDRPSSLPEPVKGKRILTWTWPNIEAFLNKL